MSFLQKYFIEAIKSNSYNAVNTSVYIAIFLIYAYFIIYPLIKNENFLNIFKTFFPFVLLGALLRVSVESYSAVAIMQRTYNPLDISFWFITPGIYILFFTICPLLYIFFKKFFNNYLKAINIFGYILFLSVFAIFINKANAILYFALIIASVIVFYAISKKFFKDLDSLLILSQFFDAIATLSALSLNFQEKHIASAFILKINPFLFISLKLIFAFAIIYISKKEDSKIFSFIKLILIFVAFATASRDSFSILFMR